jgi:sugar lactone lactonase YvrE
MSEVTAVWEAQAQLGEGPLWVAREQAIYWVDILTHRVHRYRLDSGEQTTWQFQEEITSLAARAGGGFLCTARNGFALLDLDRSEAREVNLVEAAIGNNRFNDGKVDEYGRYWAGSMDDNQAERSGSLYLLDEHQALSKKDDGYIITNGPAFNCAGDRMYHNETAGGIGETFLFDLDAAGNISNKRRFYRYTPEQGLPDGMTVDAEDCLWVAHFGGHGVTRFSADGKIIGRIDLPVPNITSCTFAGDDLDRMFITTARVGLSEAELQEYPLAGALFEYRPGVSGLPTHLYKG